jgi:murein DD-endopeptidase MepM/ murein hydrolase activator NlpD
MDLKKIKIRKPRKFIQFPLDNYDANGHQFGQVGINNGVDWGIHLGDDCMTPEGTSVKAILPGKVIYSGLHPGSEKKPNWGNIIIIQHKHPKKENVICSLYGHLGERSKQAGDFVEKGEVIGYVGKGFSPENGWWKEHLHFAIYEGPWEDTVLPGYFKKEQHRTKISYWRNPVKWLQRYSK